MIRAPGNRKIGQIFRSMLIFCICISIYKFFCSFEKCGHDTSSIDPWNEIQFYAIGIGCDRPKQGAHTHTHTVVFEYFSCVRFDLRQFDNANYGRFPSLRWTTMGRGKQQTRWQEELFCLWNKCARNRIQMPNALCFTDAVYGWIYVCRCGSDTFIENCMAWSSVLVLWFIHVACALITFFHLCRSLSFTRIPSGMIDNRVTSGRKWRDKFPFSIVEWVNGGAWTPRRRLKLHSVRSIVRFAYDENYYYLWYFMNFLGGKWIDVYCCLMLKCVQIICRALAWQFTMIMMTTTATTTTIDENSNDIS